MKTKTLLIIQTILLLIVAVALFYTAQNTQRPEVVPVEVKNVEQFDNSDNDINPEAETIYIPSQEPTEEPAH